MLLLYIRRSESMNNSIRSWNIYANIYTARLSLLANDISSLSFVYLPFSFTAVAVGWNVANQGAVAAPVPAVMGNPPGVERRWSLHKYCTRWIWSIISLCPLFLLGIYFSAAGFRFMYVFLAFVCSPLQLLILQGHHKFILIVKLIAFHVTLEVFGAMGLGPWICFLNFVQHQ